MFIFIQARDVTIGTKLVQHARVQSQPAPQITTTKKPHTSTFHCEVRKCQILHINNAGVGQFG